MASDIRGKGPLRIGAKHGLINQTREAAPLATIRAAMLVKYGCSVSSVAILLGAFLAPTLASHCCHEALANSVWIWAAIGLGTLAYFLLFSEPAEAADDAYGPVELEDDNTHIPYEELERAALAVVFVAEHERRSSEAACPHHNESPMAGSPAASQVKLEQQQPMLTCEICVQTDLEKERASDLLPTHDPMIYNSAGTRATFASFLAARIPQLWELKKFFQPVLLNTPAWTPTWATRMDLNRHSGISSVARVLQGHVPPRRVVQPFLSKELNTVKPLLIHNGNDVELPARTSYAVEPEAEHAATPPAEDLPETPGPEEEGEPETVSAATADTQGCKETLKRLAEPEPKVPPRSCCRSCCRCWCQNCAAACALLAGAYAVAWYGNPELLAGVRKALGPTLVAAEPRLEDAKASLGSLAAGVAARAGLRLGGRPGPCWHAGEWSLCSEECGTGQAKRSVYCINGLQVDCENMVGPAPADTKSCTEHEGCLWHISQWGKCDTSCGTGAMVRKVVCANGTGCEGLAKRPPVWTSCTRVHGCRWKAGPWQDCDNPCGHGERTRAVTCENGPVESCLEHDQRPSEAEPCRSIVGCRWHPNDWTPCTNSCGNGKQFRNVSCANGDEAECKEEGGAPQIERLCLDVSGCEWKLGQWSQCTATCGAGVERRTVSCANGEMKDCQAKTPQPPRERPCRAIEGCKWSVGAWSSCAADCGTGLRTRSVLCANGALGDCQNSPAEAPAASKPCINVTGCRWAAGPWGPCSNVCGNGSQFRTVFCGNGRDDDCQQISEPPDIRRDCSEMSGCLNLQTGPQCECREGDPALAVAGVLNAACGWTLSFAIMHEVVNRAVWAGSLQRGTVVLLSSPAVLLAGIGTLGAVSVLRSGLGPTTAEGHEVVTSFSQLAIGLIGLVLWATTLCGPGRHAWKVAAPIRLISSIVLLAFCGLVALTHPCSLLLAGLNAVMQLRVS